MSGTSSSTTLVSIALPVYNGGAGLARVIESVLAQSHSHLELVISDNASTDETQEVCQRFAAGDQRVVYHRQATNIGLLNNYVSAAERTNGAFVRWIGDDDSLEPEYVARTLDAFEEDERRVLVTTQMVYPDTPVHTDYDPTSLASSDPIIRLAGMLTLLTSGFAVLDPLYSLMRRDLAVLPRRNILREDEVFAIRLALAGPWGHVPAPLARRHRSEVSSAHLVELLDVPRWHRHAMDALQCRELLDWIARSSLGPRQRRRARGEVLRLYARRKRNTVRRGAAKLERMAGRPLGLAPTGPR
jgi:glycosyltransferase involved in cell wall biosynthesis